MENSDNRRPDIEQNISFNPNIDITRTNIDTQIIDSNIDVIYTNLQNAPKKRKLSQVRKKIYVLQWLRRKTLC